MQEEGHTMAEFAAAREERIKDDSMSGVQRERSGREQGKQTNNALRCASTLIKSKAAVGFLRQRPIYSADIAAFLFTCPLRISTNSFDFLPLVITSLLRHLITTTTQPFPELACGVQRAKEKRVRKRDHTYNVNLSSYRGSFYTC
jgi:hypothetical protein